MSHFSVSEDTSHNLAFYWRIRILCQVRIYKFPNSIFFNPQFCIRWNLSIQFSSFVFHTIYFGFIVHIVGFWVPESSFSPSRGGSITCRWLRSNASSQYDAALHQYSNCYDCFHTASKNWRNWSTGGGINTRRRESHIPAQKSVAPTSIYLNEK